MYLWYESKAGIHGLCISVDSFDLRCESVTYIYKYMLGAYILIENRARGSKL